MSADAITIKVYDARAGDYADRFRTEKPDRHLRAFIAALPAAAQVLDLGCGPANASAFMRAAGLRPDPVDASPAMVALANSRHEIGARLATFDDVSAISAYDGVWANFSLLHAARAALPGYLAALHRALRPGGLLHIGMKTGTGEARDTLERFYAYYGREELLVLLNDAGFTAVSVAEGTEVGLAGTSDPFIIVLART
jgi:SAM-dependent methyltransferase